MRDDGKHNGFISLWNLFGTVQLGSHLVVLIMIIIYIYIRNKLNGEDGNNDQFLLRFYFILKSLRNTLVLEKD